MAIFTPGAIISELRGSINGTTYSRNRGGPYAANKLVQTNPNTTYQQAARAIQTAGVAAWQALSTDDQALWSVFAQQQRSKPRLGTQYRLTGYTAFMRFYTYRNTYGLTGNPSPAPPVDLPALTLNYVTLSQGAFIVNVTTDTDNSNWQIVVRATPPVSAGNTTQPKTTYAVIQYSDLINGTTDFQLTSDYETHYSTLSTATGKKVFTRIDLVNRITAQHVIYLLRSDTVQASVAITLVGTATAGNTDGNNATIDLSALSLQAGDLVLVQGGYPVFRTGKNPGPLTAGYTELYSHNQTGQLVCMALAYKFMGATPDTSISCAGSGQSVDACNYQARVYRGVQPLQVEDVTLTHNGPNAAPPYTNPSITTITAQDMLIVSLFTVTNLSARTVAGYGNTIHSQTVDSNSFGNDSADMVLASPGLEAPAVWLTASTGQYITTLLALRPELP